jgi:hypothetical protein
LTTLLQGNAARETGFHWKRENGAVRQIRRMVELALAGEFNADKVTSTVLAGFDV